MSHMTPIHKNATFLLFDAQLSVTPLFHGILSTESESAAGFDLRRVFQVLVICATFDQQCQVGQYWTWAILAWFECASWCTKWKKCIGHYLKVICQGQTTLTHFRMLKTQIDP